ncbi:MAG: 2-C-methyl-D-erythritol 2,4-cyclodiphosphate synthase [SAR324 cluster bacterium]|nr:2-C-methyl-D-erythritol 2,4-cyclodiphosphate synthase [SAR324 cluster bacterium]
MRIGIGFDVHEFAESRPLIIGGVRIPYDRGLQGHSDADVLLHAIMDALLGALALGDLGAHFPDTDPGFQGIDSLQLLGTVYEKLRERQFRVVNLDSVIIAQNPKMNPHIQIMRQKIADCLQVETDCISVKATTTEHLGFTGREEGIAAQAVVLLRKQEHQLDDS